MKTIIHVVDVSVLLENLRLYCETGTGKPFTAVATAGGLGI